MHDIVMGSHVSKEDMLANFDHHECMYCKEYAMIFSVILSKQQREKTCLKSKHGKPSESPALMTGSEGGNQFSAGTVEHATQNISDCGLKKTSSDTANQHASTLQKASDDVKSQTCGSASAKCVDPAAIIDFNNSRVHNVEDKVDEVIKIEEQHTNIGFEE